MKTPSTKHMARWNFYQPNVVRPLHVFLHLLILACHAHLALATPSFVIVVSKPEPGVTEYRATISITNPGFANTNYTLKKGRSFVKSGTRMTCLQPEVIETKEHGVFTLDVSPYAYVYIEVERRTAYKDSFDFYSYTPIEWSEVGHMYTFTPLGKTLVCSLETDGAAALDTRIKTAKKVYDRYFNTPCSTVQYDSEAEVMNVIEKSFTDFVVLSENSTTKQTKQVPKVDVGRLRTYKVIINHRDWTLKLKSLTLFCPMAVYVTIRCFTPIHHVIMTDHTLCEFPGKRLFITLFYGGLSEYCDITADRGTFQVSMVTEWAGPTRRLSDTLLVPEEKWTQEYFWARPQYSHHGNRTAVAFFIGLEGHARTLWVNKKRVFMFVEEDPVVVKTNILGAYMHAKHTSRKFIVYVLDVLLQKSKAPQGTSLLAAKGLNGPSIPSSCLKSNVESTTTNRRESVKNVGSTPGKNMSFSMVDPMNLLIFLSVMSVMVVVAVCYRTIAGKYVGQGRRAGKSVGSGNTVLTDDSSTESKSKEGKSTSSTNDEIDHSKDIRALKEFITAELVHFA